MRILIVDHINSCSLKQRYAMLYSTKIKQIHIVCDYVMWSDIVICFITSHDVIMHYIMSRYVIPRYVSQILHRIARLPLHDFPTSVHGLLENTHILSTFLYILTVGHSTDLQKQCKIHFDGFWTKLKLDKEHWFTQ